MGAYVGGIGNTIATVVIPGSGLTKPTREVSAMGGWLAFSAGPFNGLTVNIGGGIDDPDDGDLAPGMRERNGYPGFVLANQANRR